MFALHLYLEKQVCSEENYLSVNLCLHQSTSIKYFFYIAENGNGKITSEIKYLFKLEINIKTIAPLPATNGQFLEHLIIKYVFIISTDFPREEKVQRTVSMITIRLLMKVTTIFVLPIPSFAMQSETDFCVFKSCSSIIRGSKWVEISAGVLAICFDAASHSRVTYA